MGAPKSASRTSLPSSQATSRHRLGTGDARARCGAQAPHRSRRRDAPEHRQCGGYGCCCRPHSPGSHGGRLGAHVRPIKMAPMGGCRQVGRAARTEVIWWVAHLIDGRIGAGCATRTRGDKFATWGGVAQATSCSVLVAVSQPETAYTYRQAQTRIQTRIMLAPRCIQVDARNEPDLNRIAAGRAVELTGAWTAGHNLWTPQAVL